MEITAVYIYTFYALKEAQVGDWAIELLILRREAGLTKKELLASMLPVQMASWSRILTSG